MWWCDRSLCSITFGLYMTTVIASRRDSCGGVIGHSVQSPLACIYCLGCNRKFA